MIRTNLPESATLAGGPANLNVSDIQRADQIINTLIISTSQADYDEITVEQLIHEYESLMC